MKLPNYYNNIKTITIDTHMFDPKNYQRSHIIVCEFSKTLRTEIYNLVR